MAISPRDILAPIISPDLSGKHATMKKTGTKAEVWAGTAMHTARKLTRADLMLNSAGKVVSKKQHANGQRAAANLKAAPQTARRPAHLNAGPSHAKGYAAGQHLKSQHGAGLLGGLLGGLLQPILGDIAPAIGSVLPI